MTEPAAAGGEEPSSALGSTSQPSERTEPSSPPENELLRLSPRDAALASAPELFAALQLFWRLLPGWDLNFTGWRLRQGSEARLAMRGCHSARPKRFFSTQIRRQTTAPPLFSERLLAGAPPRLSAADASRHVPIDKTEPPGSRALNKYIHAAL